MAAPAPETTIHATHQISKLNRAGLVFGQEPAVLACEQPAHDLPDSPGEAIALDPLHDQPIRQHEPAGPLVELSLAPR